jgi:hypothetical protein
VHLHRYLLSKATSNAPFGNIFPRHTTKTTPQDVNYPFFCSQSQYDILDGMQLSHDFARDSIYLVARVFRLGIEGMGVKLYVDPVSLQIERELEFKADKYAVTPRY